MSNLIKAYSVHYKEEKRNINLDNLASMLIEKHLAEEAAANSPEEVEKFEDGFVPLSDTMSDEDIEGYDEIDEDSEGEADDFVPLSFSSDDAPGVNKKASSIDTGEEEAIKLMLQNEIDELKRKLEALKAESADIIIRANDQAENIKQMAELMRDNLMEEFSNAGYAEGKLKAEKEINELIGSYENRKASLEADYNEKISNLGPKYASLVKACVRKITGHVVDDYDDFLLYIIKAALSEPSGDLNYIVHIPSSSFEPAKSRKEELEACLKGGARLDLVEDSLLSDDQCIIETENGILDCSLGVQLSNLERELDLLSTATDR